MERAVGNGVGAELEYTFPTDEGGPIRVYYRATPAGRLEVYVDSTADDREMAWFDRRRRARSEESPKLGPVAEAEQQWLSDNLGVLAELGMDVEDAVQLQR